MEPYTSQRKNPLRETSHFPSPKPTVWPKWEVSDDVDVGEGWVVSFPEPKLIQSFFREKGKTRRKETKERETKSLLSPFSLG